MRDAKGMVVATTFRVQRGAAENAGCGRKQQAGRSVCLMGRAMLRMTQVATEAGHPEGFPAHGQAPNRPRNIPRENLLLIVTGSQGERRAASAQLARGNLYGAWNMRDGDTFLFSSMTIPGNEREVGRIVNGLSEMALM